MLDQHLSLLVGTFSESTTSNDRHALEAWESLRIPKEDNPVVPDEPEEDLWETVLDVYSPRPGALNASAVQVSPVTQKLLSKPSLQPLLSTLRATLASDKQSDDIFTEVSDMIGADEVELLFEIIGQRKVVALELEKYMASTADGSVDDARQRMEDKLRANASRPLFSATAEAVPEVLPHVYSSQLTGNVLSHLGTSFSLPVGTERLFNDDYDEVVVPPSRPVPPKETERLIPVTELDNLAKGCFPGYTSLNRIQSIVYPTAYKSNENMLVCAPTGAGKTDVAMLTILRVLDQYPDKLAQIPNAAPSVDVTKFKIIYVAPMKALASEITRKLGKRLQWLKIKVRELTGDMQLTKQEIDETQIIVTTPEKWDVVTRKPTGEGEVAAKVKLLIIDEVHLLNDERGAVIETIVARTLRQVESSQSVIRIVGLSATLPNYVDVAEFLSVSKYTGLFYFDSSFRPVPLEQHFIGVKGKPNSPTQRKNLDRVTYEKVTEIVRRGYQAMVFVHARKETVKSALALKEAATIEGTLDDFSCDDHPQYQLYRRQIGESRNREMKQLFDHGFGIHHAGMLRSDRNMMERLFSEKVIKVLCCTATLAWGVNLPAHAVVIKGTQVYDSSRGSFVDLSVLDVLQIFGRAGRPGLESEGEGYICTSQDNLDHYLNAVTSQNPIESKFTAGIIDSLNAEISLGTVANMDDAVRWLGYTYMYVRMQKNPLTYGMSREEVANDPSLIAKRNYLANWAATKLSDARMIAFNQHKGTFTITDLGRIAAKYYIRHATIEVFNKEMKPSMTEADVLVLICRSTEFDQIQLRENELKELMNLLLNEKLVPCHVKGATTREDGTIDDKALNKEDKVNILLQTYIFGGYVEDFALVSDMAYAAQNGGRIVRALLEIAISRKWANASASLMGMSKAIEKQLWPFDQPLRQFKNLKSDVLHNLERYADDYSPSDLAALSALELGNLLHLNEIHGNALLKAAKQFPTFSMEYKLRPLGADILRIIVQTKRMFTWNDQVHGNIEPVWLWIEDEDGKFILQLARLAFRKNTEHLDTDFVISIPNGRPPPKVTIRYVSDKWLGAEDEVEVVLATLKMPKASESYTPRLDLPFLPLSAVQHAKLEKRLTEHIHGFNAIQSQTLWSLLNTRLHSLVCAPTGSGKSVLGRTLIWATLLNGKSSSWALVVFPRRSAALDGLAEMRSISKSLGLSVDLINDPSSLREVKERTIRIVTADILLKLMGSLKTGSSISDLQLVICESLEQLTAPYELAISLLRQATQSQATRFVGFSASLNNAADLAAWLDVDPFALHSFRPQDRDQSLASSTQTFTIPQSAALFKAMAKPAHSAIQSSPGEPAIVFVPSRGQCRPVAQDLLTQCALETGMSGGYLPEGVDETVLRGRVQMLLRDETLMDFILQGVGFFHLGVVREDRTRMLELYAEGIIRVLIVPRDACWTIPVRAGTIVVMGTQYVRVDPTNNERHVCDYSLDELVRMQGRAVRHNQLGRFFLFCQAEVKDTFTRFLDEGLPLESQLLEDDTLPVWYTEQRTQGKIKDKQEGAEALSWTFLARRLLSNGTYYDATSGSINNKLSTVIDTLEDSRA